jgi:hypothetical protein
LPLAVSPSLDAALIEKVVVFPTVDRARIQVRLQPPAGISSISLRAAIQTTDGESAIFDAPLEPAAVQSGQPVEIERTIPLKPRPWSPGSPSLYNLTVSAETEGMPAETSVVRTGFRSVESRDGQILLNGRPIFLRGLAINPPGRGVPDATAFARQFAYDYVKFLRSKNFNCIRLNLDFNTDPRAQIWFDACDELGMLVYQGCYGSPPTGDKNRRTKDTPPDDVNASVAAYREVFETYARHPSIIIYVLSNELPYDKRRGPLWHRFLTTVHEQLRTWDATRLYIGNAGYGEGREGDLNDVHRYWGWYYNSFLTYYNLRQAREIFGEKGAVQPFTFSECVGSFTSARGEFNLIYRKQLGAQLEWTGHSPDQAENALAYQAFMANRACESFRTMREVNPRLAGLMPFTILFYDWNGITSFDQMRSKPVVDAMARAYQPVLLSLEMWTPQVYTDRPINAFAHIVNDSEDFSSLEGAELHVELAPAVRAADLRVRRNVGRPLPSIPYFGHYKHRFSLVASGATGNHVLVARIVRNGVVIAENRVPIFIADRTWRAAFPRLRTSPRLALYDPHGATAAALDRLAIKTQRVTDLTQLAADTALIIGAGAAPALDLSAFVRAGGRVLLLAQDAAKFTPDWLPARVQMLTGSANDPAYLTRKRPTRDGMNINIERPDHPVFEGLGRARFHLWSDQTGWDQTKPGFPAVYPVTHGFRLTRAEDLARVAVLANYDRGLEGVALCEMFEGKGSILFTGLGLVERAALDPIADRLLTNLVSYLTTKEHPLHPLIADPIHWGKYETEKGLITGPLNGLVVNCRWVRPPTDPNATPLPDNTGEWNTRPGEQFVPAGRRAIGPYGYSTATSMVESDRNAPNGTGFFHASLPPGRTAMVTTVENPGKTGASITIDVNGRPQDFTVAAGETTTLRSEFVASVPNTVAVRYTAAKVLVIHQTAFE